MPQVTTGQRHSAARNRKCLFLPLFPELIPRFPQAAMVHRFRQGVPLYDSLALLAGRLDHSRITRHWHLGARANPPPLGWRRRRTTPPASPPPADNPPVPPANDEEDRAPSEERGEFLLFLDGLVTNCGSQPKGNWRQ